MHPRVDPLRMVTCPYEPLHVVLRSKLLEHLATCREQHPELNVAFCIHNENHLVDIDRFAAHCRACPDNPRNKERVLLEYIARTGGFNDRRGPDGGGRRPHDDHDYGQFDVSYRSMFNDRG